MALSKWKSENTRGLETSLNNRIKNFRLTTTTTICLTTHHLDTSIALHCEIQTRTGIRRIYRQNFLHCERCRSRNDNHWTGHRWATTFASRNLVTGKVFHNILIHKRLVRRSSHQFSETNFCPFQVCAAVRRPAESGTTRISEIVFLDRVAARQR